MCVGRNTRNSALGVPGASVRAGFLRQTEDLLADDVALHLRRTGVDRAGPGIEEGSGPRVGGVWSASLVGPKGRLGLAAGGYRGVHTENIHAEFSHFAVIFGPKQLADRRLGAGMLALKELREYPLALEFHDANLGVTPRQALTDHRVVGFAVLAG